MSAVKIKRAYGAVLLTGSLVAGEYAAFFWLEREQRISTFNNEMMDLGFNEITQKTIGDDVARYGYPDDGNGRYIKDLPYVDWYYMNVARRTIMNNTENIVVLLPLSLVNGVIFPKITTGLLGMYCIGRYLYAEGYRENGAFDQVRIQGAVMSHTATFTTVFMTLGLGI